mmetsp:Transcript_30648/g.74277  ORF Transcript_30648/g.74277 Transcript_30648/m.74277 type:complete len:233 (-) Transcript_30648:180-878(-)
MLLFYSRVRLGTPSPDRRNRSTGRRTSPRRQSQGQGQGRQTRRRSTLAPSPEEAALVPSPDANSPLAQTSQVHSSYAARAIVPYGQPTIDEEQVVANTQSFDTAFDTFATAAQVEEDHYDGASVKDGHFNNALENEVADLLAGLQQREREQTLVSEAGSDAGDGWNFDDGMSQLTTDLHSVKIDHESASNFEAVGMTIDDSQNVAKRAHSESLKTDQSGSIFRYKKTGLFEP